MLLNVWFQGTGDTSWTAVLWGYRHVVVGLCDSRAVPRLAAVSRLIGVRSDPLYLTDTGTSQWIHAERRYQNQALLCPRSLRNSLSILAPESEPSLFIFLSMSFYSADVQRLKWKSRGDGTVHQLWARQLVVIDARAFLWNVRCGNTWSLSNWWCRNCVP